MSSTMVEEKKVMVFRGGKWIFVSDHEQAQYVTWNDLKWFYGNQIDYWRVVLCVVAGFTLLHDELALLTAFLLITSTLLDWVDGPVARAYGQCSIFGSGIDWVADIMCQLVIAVWWARVDASVIPWLVLACTIEVTTGFFDFAVTATAKYPVLGKNHTTGFYIILGWCMPENSYSHLGTFLWLAYPFYSVHCVLLGIYGVHSGFLYWLNHVTLLVPTIMYLWCELAYGAHIITSWTEPSRKLIPYIDEIVSDDAQAGFGGFTNMGILPVESQNLLHSMWDKISKEITVSESRIYWLNLWSRTKEEPILTADRIADVDKASGAPGICAWAQQMSDKYWYGEGEYALDGFGVIVNPTGNKVDQKWHVDYSQDYSTMFIPMSTINPHNAMQYVAPGFGCPEEVYQKAVANPDEVNLDVLTEGATYKISQLIAPKFSMLKMNYRTIHRGIANSGGFDRVVFWISVKRNPAVFVAKEGMVAVFESDTRLGVSSDPPGRQQDDPKRAD